ncbi:alpha/beta hydrolase [Cellulomonas hominis]|uniref:Alpha-beta hydrolase superfamily lysophospholipase n=1 Tax=Cellulomonas hominis TaxID=156981 RepID=A0A511FAK8_9CELL|nr:alpha/beta hydrolase [Cellulomonas hominis]MBB5471423.1 alpha-beta hydrolase superfamily lysophospholipase [Cellulomonas hominis]NKY07064.1 alpha/beta hydrolase [Cellulomonas hominis]GEL46253.1 alpha/beta hydrolase [Cellulomonas hominis]
MTVDDAVPDVLGGDWVQRTLHLRPDGQGSAVATLVHRRDAAADRTRPAVLYVHGFVDYFFQTHVADALADRGYDLYALDLRDYGRSIRPGREPNDTRSLATYAEELDAAVRLVRAEHDRVVLLGHSTGGLVAALWAHHRRGRGLVDAVVLNSPWLDLRGSVLERTALTWLIVHAVGVVAPRLVVSHLGPDYGRALHAGSGGEWAYDLAWKPHEGFPVRAGFVRAVRRGHAEVARGLDVDVPVLVLASDASGPDDRWHDGLLTTDSVLDVADMRRLAPRMGEDVTYVEVAGGAHDLALSPLPARTRYLDEVVGWLDVTLAGG